MKLLYSGVIKFSKLKSKVIFRVNEVANSLKETVRQNTDDDNEETREKAEKLASRIQTDPRFKDDVILDSITGMLLGEIEGDQEMQNRLDNLIVFVDQALSAKNYRYIEGKYAERVRAEITTFKPQEGQNDFSVTENQVFSIMAQDDRFFVSKGDKGWESYNENQATEAIKSIIEGLQVQSNIQGDLEAWKERSDDVKAVVDDYLGSDEFESTGEKINLGKPEDVTDLVLRTLAQSRTEIPQKDSSGEALKKLVHPILEHLVEEEIQVFLNKEFGKSINEAIIKYQQESNGSDEKISIETEEILAYLAKVDDILEKDESEVLDLVKAYLEADKVVGEKSKDIKEETQNTNSSQEAEKTALTAINNSSSDKEERPTGLAGLIYDLIKALRDIGILPKDGDLTPDQVASAKNSAVYQRHNPDHNPSVENPPGTVGWQQARTELGIPGNFILKSTGAGTSERGNSRASNRSCLDGLRTSTISGARRLLDHVGGKRLTITGGTERGHANGTYSHFNGYKLDFASDPHLIASLDNIQMNESKTLIIGGQKMKFYRHAPDHIDVLFYPV